MARVSSRLDAEDRTAIARVAAFLLLLCMALLMTAVSLGLAVRVFIWLSGVG